MFLSCHKFTIIQRLIGTFARIIGNYIHIVPKNGVVMKIILLSFDIEEFDIPKDHGVNFSLQDGINASSVGTEKILDILKLLGVKATFFCTANFVQNAPDIIKRIIDEGHEIASHGVDHWTPKSSDIRDSKQIIEKQTGLTVYGYRQPRMGDTDYLELDASDYLYVSSLNPTFIPGRYYHLNTPRLFFTENNVIQIPASVTPFLRIPLFWLSLHTFPQWFYHCLAFRVLNSDGYLSTYFHPWEFIDLNSHPEWKIPSSFEITVVRIWKNGYQSLLLLCKIKDINLRHIMISQKE